MVQFQFFLFFTAFAIFAYGSYRILKLVSPGIFFTGSDLAIYKKIKGLNWKISEKRVNDTLFQLESENGKLIIARIPRKKYGNGSWIIAKNNESAEVLFTFYDKNNPLEVVSQPILKKNNNSSIEEYRKKAKKEFAQKLAQLN